MKKRVFALMLALGMTFAAPVAAAEMTEERIVALEERIAQLEARVAQLEVLLGAQAETAAAAENGMEPVAEPYTVEIGIGTVMRETPEEKGRAAAKLRVGNEVTVLGKSEEWLQIEYKDEVGYVNRSLVEAE